LSAAAGDLKNGLNGWTDSLNAPFLSNAILGDRDSNCFFQFKVT